ncbi:MAG: pyrimidine 5'-nucleotidase [Ferrovibrio sp.]|uniref:pyrimidine 5'-nucleotidase n=1 Tax=Ferrovibrio sp. TaxID=1917215 RepID=UPI0026178DD1|nr:pyrimidine 5'-nucleotidase [Ferrovibrio sp.]MCW0236524.1 pyrimidine 5'-nucleotidase [Ferrovibrio sp.]
MISTASASASAPVAAPLAGPALRDAETWIFDLDNTLYPAECNLFEQVQRRMGEFIATTFALDAAAAAEKRKYFFHTHGTTLRGLMVEHGIDPADFLDYVHDIDLSAVAALPALAEALDRLPGRKLIYTNGTVAHADRIMRKLGVDHHFEAVFDIVASDYVPKPDMTPYRTMLQKHGVDPRGAVMVEDMARNLKPAAELGMTTIWVPTTAAWSQPDADGHVHIHHTAPDLTAFLAGLHAAPAASAG